MSLIPLAAAKVHLRVEDDYPDDQVAPKLAAAEARAAQFLNRALFASSEARDEAIAAVPAALTAAAGAHAAALAAAAGLEDAAARTLLIEAAERTYCEARTAARETLAGIVLTDDIRAAILLQLSHLFVNRTDVTVGATQALVYGSQYLLMPYRIGWGG